MKKEKKNAKTQKAQNMKNMKRAKKIALVGKSCEIGKVRHHGTKKMKIFIFNNYSKYTLSYCKQ